MKIPEKTFDILRKSLSKKFIAQHPLIISNNCFASWIYYYSHTPFNHPFTWAIINPNDMGFLVENFWNMNFNNVEFGYADETRDEKTRTYVKARIDNKIDLNYVHYLKVHEYGDRRYNIISDNIMDMVKEKYERRINRLKKIREKIQPFFLFYFYSYTVENDESYVKLIEQVKNRNDVHVVYDKFKEDDMDFNQTEYPNMFTYNRPRKRNQRYAILEYLNDQCK